MSKFKVGDHVEIVRGVSKGHKGVIDRVTSSKYMTSGKHVYSFKGSYVGYFDDDLEHSRVKNPRLARKMFPKAEVSEDGEWIYV